jgi:hypothetical protein
MDIIEKKFENFKVFLKTIDNISATYLQIIEVVSLDQFLTGLKQQYSDKTANELIQEVAKKSGVNLHEINEDTKLKFVRYITYFKQVSQI